jgi:hypothetical protein
MSPEHPELAGVRIQQLNSATLIGKRNPLPGRIPLSSVYVIIKRLL